MGVLGHLTSSTPSPDRSDRFDRHMGVEPDLTASPSETDSPPWDVTPGGNSEPARRPNNLSVAVSNVEVSNVEVLSSRTVVGRAAEPAGASELLKEPIPLITLPKPSAGPFTAQFGLGAHHPKRIVCLDAETYYSADFTLRKLDMATYIKSAQFETLGWSMIDGDGEPRWYEGETIIPVLQAMPLHDTIFVMHNAAFDGSILAYRHGLTPALYVDTMSMSRGLLKHALGKKGSVGLENVAAHLGLGVKGDALKLVAGMRLADLKKSDVYPALQDYALQDVRLCKRIFEKLEPHLPTAEFDIIDDTVRMVTHPMFEADVELLGAHLTKTQRHKDELLERAGIERAELMSNDKLAAAFERLGVVPPTKISPKTGKVAWAFSKNDLGFQALLEHDDETVRELAQARLGVKSTLEESRTQRFINIAEAMDGRMPVELAYCGAHTTRFSASGGTNFQNLPSRGDTTLRMSLMAPEGYKVIAVDAAQIEARLSAWLGGEVALLRQFANGEDIYCSFASRLYGRPVTKADKNMRWAAKTAVLALQFGQGADSFMQVANTQAKAQGIDMVLTKDEAQRIVNVYRKTYTGIAGAWKKLGTILRLMAANLGSDLTFGPCVVQRQSITLPNGMRLNYHNLRYEGMNVVYDYAGVTKKIYPAKLLENIVQALDRVHVMEAWLRTKARCPEARLVNQVHDEIVMIAPDALAETYKIIALEEMCRRPVWAQNLPLSAEAHVAERFGECK
jgi:DNA polymerase I-like protein with 3'-5' exonuclease and polymerase domains